MRHLPPFWPRAFFGPPLPLLPQRRGALSRSDSLRGVPCPILVGLACPGLGQGGAGHAGLTGRGGRDRAPPLAAQAGPREESARRHGRSPRGRSAGERERAGMAPLRWPLLYFFSRPPTPQAAIADKCWGLREAHGAPGKKKNSTRDGKLQVGAREKSKRPRAEPTSVPSLHRPSVRLREALRARGHSPGRSSLTANELALARSRLDPKPKPDEAVVFFTSARSCP